MEFNFRIGENLFNSLREDETVAISVQIDDTPSEATTIKLKRNDKLSDVREVLNNCEIINNSLLFSHKIPKKNEKIKEGTSYTYSILRERECQFTLNYIIEIINEKYIIYLKNSLNWNILNELHRLDYGCTMDFDGIKIAEKRAFIMKDCKVDKIGVEGYKKGQLKFETQNDWMKKTNLFFNVDAKIMNFVKLGLSLGKSQNRDFKDEIKSTYDYIELEKASIKLNKESLELTTEFKTDIENAIKSKDPEEFKKITENYGQFIAIKVILGGRVYFKNINVLSENTLDKSSKVAASAGVGPLNVKIGNNVGDSERRSKFYSFNHMRLLGGKYPGGDFDEKNWIQSLENYLDWDRIKLQDPVSIFHLLPDDLRKKTFESIGKRILYSEVLEYNYISNEDGRPNIVELTSLGISRNISEILLDKEAECNIFATVVDTEESKNDFFTCQILLPQDGKPSLIIHCIQRNIRKREYKLKIGIMIVGYDTNFDFTRSDFNVQLEILKHKVNASSNQIFNMNLLDFEYRSGPPHIGIPVLNKSDSSNNTIVIGHHFYEREENKIGAYTFSYCLKEHRYVDLPNFTFCVLMILHYDKNYKYGTLPLKRNNKWNISTVKPFQPRYISLYSKGEEHGPIFLKQKFDRIKIKYLSCSEKNCSNCLCKYKKLSVKNVECKFFDPYISSVD